MLGVRGWWLGDRDSSGLVAIGFGGFASGLVATERSGGGDPRLEFHGLRRSGGLATERATPAYTGGLPWPYIYPRPRLPVWICRLGLPCRISAGLDNPRRSLPPAGDPRPKPTGYSVCITVAG
uniref:Uncharacterized protein n=1 Tax=Fagus sylvatica TaxID=28930 RepID=A0A2N9GZB2_FAGSY